MSQYISGEEFSDLTGLTPERMQNGRRPVYPDTLDRFLTAGSGLVDSAIAIKYKGSTPIAAADPTVKLAVAGIIGYHVIMRIGAANDAELKSFKDAHDVWQKWLGGIREGTQQLPGMTEMAPKTDYRGADVAGPDDLPFGACERGGRRNFWGHNC